MNIERYELSDIDLGRLKPVKVVQRYYGVQDHSRWIMRDRRPGRSGSTLFYKIWNPTYVRRAGLSLGIAAGFYDRQTVPALRGLIYSDNLCRGYVMERCERQKVLDPDFFALIRKRTSETGVFAVQFSPTHTMNFGGTRSLVDLEGVYPTADLRLVADHHSAFAYAPYADFVAGLFREEHGELDVAMPPIPVEDVPCWGQTPVPKALAVMRSRALRLRVARAPNLSAIII